MRAFTWTVLALLVLPALPIPSPAVGQSRAESEQLVITEIMYNSLGPDVEWFELYNPADSALDLTGWYVLDNDNAHDKVFLTGSLEPRGVLVVIGDEADFNAQYSEVTNYNPNVFGGHWGLNNDGDAVRVFNASEQLVDEVWFNDETPWPLAPDGGGPSLWLTSIGLDNNQPASWQASPLDWGSPGEVEPSVPSQRRSWGWVKTLFR